jgi:hypothetical protein
VGVGVGVCDGVGVGGGVGATTVNELIIVSESERL